MTQTRAKHRHPALLTALDVSLVVAVMLFTLWVVLVIVMLVDGATKAGA